MKLRSVKLRNIMPRQAAYAKSILNEVAKRKASQCVTVGSPCTLGLLCPQ